MNPISNQLPYTPINPPAPPKTRYPVLMAITQRVALAILLAGFSAAFGVAFSLSSVSLIEPALTWAIFGTMASLPLLILGNLPTPVESYRQGCIEQIRSAVNNPRALAALKNLQSFFYYPLNRFAHYYQLGLLYNEIGAVSANLDRQRPDVCKAWVQLLEHLKKLQVKLPGGELVHLNLKEFSRLQENRERIKTKWLTNRFSGPSRKSLEKIQAITRQTIGRDRRSSVEHMAEMVAKNPDSHIIVSRDTAGEIVGYGWYFTRGDTYEIASIARKPTYARLGIGMQLISQMLHSFDQEKQVELSVRKSNLAAIRLFQTWGFERVEDRKGYYKFDPAEDGILMRLDWEKYNERVNRQ